MDQYVETTNNRCFVADRDAIGYICNNKEQFQRAVLCLGLGVAYRTVINDFMHKVTQATNSDNIAELLKLYRQILTFNAGNYFRYPVDLNSHELRMIWDEIHQNWCLQELNQELTNQLTAVAELLRAEQDKHDAEMKEQQTQLVAEQAECDIKKEESFFRLKGRGILDYATGALRCYFMVRAFEVKYALRSNDFLKLISLYFLSSTNIFDGWKSP